MMPVARLTQIRSGITAQYELTYQGRTLYTARIPVNFSSQPIHILKNNEAFVSIRRNNRENNKNVFRRLPDAHLNNCDLITPAGDVCGSIYKKWVKRFHSYYIFWMDFAGEVLAMYEVGMGKNGIKLPVFQDDRQIALIEKDVVTYDNKDGYTISFSARSQLEAAFVMAMYYDNLFFSNAGEFAAGSKEVCYFISTNRELKAKYNPDWRPEE